MVVNRVGFLGQCPGNTRLEKKLLAHDWMVLVKFRQKSLFCEKDADIYTVLSGERCKSFLGTGTIIN